MTGCWTLDDLRTEPTSESHPVKLRCLFFSSPSFSIHHKQQFISYSASPVSQPSLSEECLYIYLHKVRDAEEKHIAVYTPNHNSSK